MERRPSDHRAAGVQVSFHQQEWKTRYAALGDQAEAAFLEAHPKAHRLGLCRPEFSMNGMLATMRYAPDFMLKDRLVEVMGISTRKDALLKVKMEKLNALTMWSAIGDVWLWVYDSSKKTSWFSPLDNWLDACWIHGETAVFDDNQKPYWALHAEHFPQ